MRHSARAEQPRLPLELAVDATRLDMLVPQEELHGRLAEGPTSKKPANPGHLKMCNEHVLGADAGRNLDFLRNLGGPPALARPGAEADGHCGASSYGHNMRSWTMASHWPNRGGTA